MPGCTVRLQSVRLCYGLRGIRPIRFEIWFERKKKRFAGPYSPCWIISKNSVLKITCNVLCRTLSSSASIIFNVIIKSFLLCKIELVECYRHTWFLQSFIRHCIYLVINKKYKNGNVSAQMRVLAWRRLLTGCGIRCRWTFWRARAQRLVRWT